MASTRPAETTACAHHWVLPRPGGPTSNGVCKHCGAERQFNNNTATGWVIRSAPHNKK